jgi:dCMP deaminase
MRGRMMSRKWDERFMTIAQMVALWSKDPDTKVGAILVKNRRIYATGYNGLPEGIDDDIPGRMDRPEKYKWFEHAERNVLCNVDATDSTMYTTLWPCADCARGIVQAKVDRVVVSNSAETRPHWEESFETARDMFEEAGILVDQL